MLTTRDKSHAASRREGRRREAVTLRDTGLTLREIGERLGVSGQTVFNDLKAVGYRQTLDSVPPSHNGHNGTTAALRLLGLPSQGKGGRDWDALLSEAVSLLKERAEAGSVSAASTLAKLAIAERTKETAQCSGHVSQEDVDGMIQSIVEMFVNEFEGPFVRSCGRVGVFGVAVHVADSLERVKTHFDRLAEAEAVAA